MCQGHISRLMITGNWPASMLQLLLIQYEAFSAMQGILQLAVPNFLYWSASLLDPSWCSFYHEVFDCIIISCTLVLHTERFSTIKSHLNDRHYQMLLGKGINPALLSKSYLEIIPEKLIQNLNERNRNPLYFPTIIMPLQSWLILKKKEAVVSYDHVYHEGTYHLKRESMKGCVFNVYISTTHRPWHWYKENKVIIIALNLKWQIKRILYFSLHKH